MKRDASDPNPGPFEGAFGGVFGGRRVLITGHTGFKGSWLALWLQSLGAQVCGLALPAADANSHHAVLGLSLEEVLVDIRDAAAVHYAVQRLAPEMVFHLAAQPLVRLGYRDPVATWGTNVMGLVHVLQAVRASASVRLVVNVTSDKCYAHTLPGQVFRETDQLGGSDPYSASKACAEIVSASYRDSYFARHEERGQPMALATVRAGNVIGGGDWAADRLVPDLVRAAISGQPCSIRQPQATRPWQHVLDPLAGYLLLAQRLWQGASPEGGAWNFGPDAADHVSVGDVVARLAAQWPVLRTQADTQAQPSEAQTLALDSRKARSVLGWRPVWGLTSAVARTARWYRRWHEHGMASSQDDLLQYMADAQVARASWLLPRPAATQAQTLSEVPLRRA